MVKSVGVQFDVYDADSSSSDLSQHDFVGTTGERELFSLLFFLSFCVENANTTRGLSLFCAGFPFKMLNTGILGRR